MKTLTTALLGLATLMAGAGVGAQDRADIDRTQIIGNRELPKVLYIVPWKQPLPGVLSGRPVQSVLDEALAPLDRSVFRRQIDYGGQVQAQLQAQSQARAAPPAPDKAAAAPPSTPSPDSPAPQRATR